MSVHESQPPVHTLTVNGRAEKPSDELVAVVAPDQDRAWTVVLMLLLCLLPESCVVDSGILTALCLPPVERVVIVNNQSAAEAEGGLVYTVCSEMEVESENKDVYVEGAESAEAAQAQWFGLASDVKPEMEAVVVADPAEAGRADEPLGQPGTLMIGEDGKVTVLGGVEKKRRGRKRKCPVDQDFEALTKRGDPDFEVMWTRPVRKNRGLKMKRYLSQWRKTGRKQGGPKRLSRGSEEDELEDRTCKVCGKVLSHAKFLSSHLSRHTEEVALTCPDCKKQFKTSRYLGTHKCPARARAGGKEAQEEDGGEQSLCETSEEQLSDLAGPEPDYGLSAEGSSSKEQKSPDLADGPYYCPHCSAEFKCRQTFRCHLRSICYAEQQVDPEQPEDGKHCFRCDECDKAFKYKSTLDSHKQTHNPLYCEVCMKLVRDPEALAIHKEAHTPFQCNHCEENFPVFKALHKHYVDVHNPAEPFTCRVCLTTFASLKRFIRHEWKHTGYQPFQCPHCAKRFRSYSDLVEHQKKHTKAYPFLCWECGKKFRHGVTLTRHVERVHRSGEPVIEKPLPSFPCSQCDKVFTSRRCLLKHENFHHKGLRFPCEHCGKGFFGKDALVRHTLIHTGERPFKCDDCDKCFRSAAELKIHRRYHTGERPFKCSICEKGFVQSCFLTLHMRTHTGERPYICTTCGKGFSSLHGLKRHKRLVHA